MLSAMAQPVHVIGVSLDLGGNRRGVDMGPSALPIAGLHEPLAAPGLTLVRNRDHLWPITEKKNIGQTHKK
jgi:arginase family enzyme